MGYEDVLRQLTELKDGASETSAVEVPATLLASAVSSISELQEELQNAKDMLMMKPSMAKRLNERIRLLEEEIEQLRAKNKVEQMEKKIQNLQAELKASYATKNFTLKNNLLELEKKYQGALQTNPDLREMWNDVAHILGDDAKEVMPSYMSRSSNFLRVGTMARPGAPLQHSAHLEPTHEEHEEEHPQQHPQQQHSQQQEAEDGAAEPLSAVQAVKKQLEVKIEQAVKEAALPGSTTIVVPLPTPDVPIITPSKRPGSSGSGQPPSPRAATAEKGPAVEAGEAGEVDSSSLQVGVAREQFGASARPSADGSYVSVESEYVRQSLATLRKMFNDLASEMAQAQRSLPVREALTAKVNTVESCLQQLLSTVGHEPGEEGINDETLALLASVAELRALFERLGQAEPEPEWRRDVDRKMELVVDKVQQLQGMLQANAAAATAAADPAAAAAAENGGPGPSTAAPADDASAPWLHRRPAPLPLTTSDLQPRSSSLQDDLWPAATPSVAKADVHTLVSLFSSFAQDLAEQQLSGDGATPSASELVQYFKLFMNTHGSGVLRRLLNQQGPAAVPAAGPAQGGAAAGSTSSSRQDSADDAGVDRAATGGAAATSTVYFTTASSGSGSGAGPAALAEPKTADAVATSYEHARSGTGATAPDRQPGAGESKDEPERPDGTPPVDATATTTAAGSRDGDAAGADKAGLNAPSTSLPPLSPSAPLLPPSSLSLGDASASVADGGPSSTGKKTFNVVARAMHMLNTKYKSLLPDTPETDALFSDLTNMLENVIATHELKSQASRQIIARSLKASRGSAPGSVASLGNWDSVGTAGSPTAAMLAESPLKGSLRGPGSDGVLTPVSHRTPRGSLTPADASAPTSGSKPAAGGEEQADGSAAQEAARSPGKAAAGGEGEDGDAGPSTPGAGDNKDDGGAAEGEEAGVSGADAATDGQGGEAQGGGYGLEMLEPKSPEPDKKVKELQNENEYLTRILIDAKVELADTKGEYMALLRALRKALSRENTARAKLDELERVVSVMAPGGPGASALYGEEMMLRPIRTRQNSEEEGAKEAAAKEAAAAAAAAAADAAAAGGDSAAAGAAGQSAAGGTGPKQEEGEIQPA